MRSLISRFKAGSYFSLIIIFTITVTIYLINNRTISSGDTFPNSLLAFNILENHTLDFDIFRSTRCPNSYESCYFFMNGLNGHLTSAYPIGAAIVTFPIYTIFYIILKLFYHQTPIDITSLEFEPYRLLCEKIAATIITSCSVVIFFIASELKFRKSAAWIATIIFAFATNTWVTSSQNLGQSTVSNFIIVSLILLIFKIHRSHGRIQTYYIFAASVACGLLPGIRSTSLAVAVFTLIYLLKNCRRHLIIVFLGLSSALPCLIWNKFHFGNFTGGYGLVFQYVPAYHLTFEHFYNAFLGTFFSPSRGILIFSPVLIYCIPGLYRLLKCKFRKSKDDKFILFLTVPNFIILASYCFYYVWWGGSSYGPRLTSETFPILCFLVGYFADHLAATKLGPLFSIRKKIFIVTIIISIFVQFVGAFSNGFTWDRIPLSSDKYQYRLWQVQDNVIQRSAHFTFHHFFPLLQPRVDTDYLSKAAGESVTIVEKETFYLQRFYNDIPQRMASKIEVIDKNYNPMMAEFSVPSKHRKLIKIQAKNTGKVQWYGYKEALLKGETVIMGDFYNDKNQRMNETRLYFDTSAKPQDTGEAIGEVTFPDAPGDYRLVFNLIAEAVGEFPLNNSQKPLANFIIHILASPKK